MAKHIRTLLVLALLLPTGIGRAAVIRGLLRRSGNPAPGIAVTISSAQSGRSKAAYSGNDGMYYIPNIKAGNYTLEVWVKPNAAPMTFNIHVVEPSTDVNPINVP